MGIKYQNHQYSISVDLKMVHVLLGQQNVYKEKYPCFLSLQNSEGKKNHWAQKEWRKSDSMAVGKEYIINTPIVGREKIILPPLHVMLDLMKQFLKALNKDGLCFAYMGKCYLI